MKPRRAAIVFAALAVAAGSGIHSSLVGQTRSLQITHGVASGDVTADSAIVWARANGPAELIVEYDTDSGFADPQSAKGTNSSDSDFAAQVWLTGLEAGTRYYYRLHFDNPDNAGRSSPTEQGSFRTAPDASTSDGVRFVVGGDLGGQGYCREVGRGYDIFARMAELSPHFFIANGDLIYADGECPPHGPRWQNIPGEFRSITSSQVDWMNAAQVRAVYFGHWRYNRADVHVQQFLRHAPMYVQWDDHEVINDFGASWPSWIRMVERRGYQNIVTAGRQALFAFHPVQRHPTEPNRIYRSFRWGRNVDLFLLDARSYRSLNDLADSPSHEKTMVGKTQLAWLKEGLAASRATWKVVSSDVPLAAPTGSNAQLYGRDGWANGSAADYSSRTGFERELQDLMKFLDAQDVRNVVFVATDVHFAMNVRYEFDADGDGDTLLLHELVSGPLSAGRSPVPSRLDPTLSPAILFAEGGIFNFGFVRVEPQADGAVHLVADVRDETGRVRFGSTLDLVPETER